MLSCNEPKFYIMKRPLILAIFLATSFCFSQVGVNTSTPSETLEVNGTLKINTTNQGGVTTTELGGISSSGVFRKIDIGTNLVLKSNVLSSKSAFDHSFGTISLTVKANHDVDLLLDAAELNEGKSIIRINNTAGDTEITGIKDGYDGQQIWLYPVDGKLTIKTLNTNSLVANRIEANAKPGCLVYGMISLVYDGTRSLWIIMQNHQ